MFAKPTIFFVFPRSDSITYAKLSQVCQCFCVSHLSIAGGDGGSYGIHSHTRTQINTTHLQCSLPSSPSSLHTNTHLHNAQMHDVYINVRTCSGHIAQIRRRWRQQRHCEKQRAIMTVDHRLSNSLIRNKNDVLRFFFFFFFFAFSFSPLLLDSFLLLF